MTTVAIIGADGAGKTTIANKLAEECPVPTRYLYMGPNIESSNITLPTSRLILFFKLWSYKRTAKREGITDPKFISTHHNAHRKVKRGRIGSTLRLFNRLAEGCFRQLISWLYQLRGFVVVYDRHFLFEAATAGDHKRRPPTDRLYYWLLANVLPQPELVIFLDASPEVLFARKGEGTLDYLQRKREVCLAEGKKTANFVRVDASRPLDQVLAEVSQRIVAFHSTLKNHKRHRPDLEVQRGD
jgi:thymidylate kinase